jgi:hypothetical protein
MKFNRCLCRQYQVDMKASQQENGKQRAAMAKAPTSRASFSERGSMGQDGNAHAPSSLMQMQLILHSFVSMDRKGSSVTSDPYTIPIKMHILES